MPVGEHEELHTGVFAVAEVSRGPPMISANSPQYSPGPRVAIRLPFLVSSTSPSTIAKNSRPRACPLLASCRPAGSRGLRRPSRALLTALASRGRRAAGPWRAPRPSCSEPGEQRRAGAPSSVRARRSRSMLAVTGPSGQARRCAIVARKTNPGRAASSGSRPCLPAPDHLQGGSTNRDHGGESRRDS